MSDNLTEAGAGRLAKAIREYWEARGAKPRVYVGVDTGSLRADREATMFVVRSDMVNGLPRGASGLGEAP